MRIIVRGEPYDLSRVTIGEAAAIEKVTGKPFETLAKSPSVVGMQALVWIAMKRADPSLRFSATEDIPFEEISVELDEDETDTEADGTSVPLGSE